MPSGSELLIVVLAVVLLFGGKELPRVMRTLGKWTAVFKSSVNDIRRELNRISIEEELRERDREERGTVQKMLDQKENSPALTSDRSSRQDEVAEATGEERKKTSQSIETPVENRAFTPEEDGLTRIRQEARQKALAMASEGVVARGAVKTAQPKRKPSGRGMMATSAANSSLPWRLW